MIAIMINGDACGQYFTVPSGSISALPIVGMTPVPYKLAFLSSDANVGLFREDNGITDMQSIVELLIRAQVRGAPFIMRFFTDELNKALEKAGHG